MAIPNPTLSIIAVLKEDSPVSALVSTRVFGEELPNGETNNMPRPCIVIASNGGRFDNDLLQVAVYRFQVRSYGATLEQAANLDFAVYDALKHLIRWGSLGMAGILTVSVESGPFLTRDPDTRWPYSMTLYRAIVGEV